MFDKTKKLTKQIWWVILLTGVAGILFGALTLFLPGITLVTLIYMLAIFVVISGVIGLFEAISNIKKDRLWWLTLVFALVGISVGVYLARNPMTTASIFVISVSLLILVRSIFDLVVASYMDKKDVRWLWIITGILGIIAAGAIVLYPVAASLAFIWVLGLYALIHGVMTVGFAMQIRKDVKKLK